MFILPDYIEPPKQTIEHKSTPSIATQPDDDINVLSENEMAFVLKTFSFLKRIGIVKTKHQYCKEMLGKSPDYICAIRSMNRQPSVSCLYALSRALQDKIVEEDGNFTISNTLNKLYTECEQLLIKRIIKTR